ncbi:MAG: hypothetical protein KAH77_01335 [Thiomargarita sp.]|nr:hypothetical protein [Thiomargarita sp.]
MSTYVEQLVDKAIQTEQSHNKTEPLQDVIIKLTPSQIEQVEKFATALGLGFGVMLNSAAKYAIFYAQNKSVPVHQLYEYPTKIGTDSIKEKITLATRFKLEQAGIKLEDLSKCIITGIQLLYKQLITTDEKTWHTLIDSIANHPPALKRQLGKRWITQIGLDIQNKQAASSCRIEGTGFIKGKRVFFQSNLRKKPLDKQIINALSHQFQHNKTELAIIVAISYAKIFDMQLKQDTQQMTHFTYHLLTLEDCLNKTTPFQNALNDLTSLSHLDIEG